MKKRLKCDFCHQKIKGEPYNVEYYKDDGFTLEDFESRACEPCAQVLKMMAESFNSVLEKEGGIE